MREVKKQAPAYKVVGIEPGLIYWDQANIDLAAQSDEDLEKLYNRGCPYIAPVTKDASASEV